MSSNKPYPLLSTLLAKRALPVADADLSHLVGQAGAKPLLFALAIARRLLEALEGHPLPPSAAAETAPPPTLAGPVQVPEGVRPLVGELAYLALEMGRQGDAIQLFDLLGALAPEHAAGPVGRAQVLILIGKPEAAVVAAREAVAREPGGAEAVAALTEALLFVGERSEARRVLTTANRPVGPSASWLRLLRLGLDEGWLKGGESCAP